ncbi:MAG: phosphomannomutase/phosphoglucomutase [Polyangiaceae bacterium]|nr:phosphomannomutase/phosphoglucomutase [Polyangiaceae bacterium]
MQLPRSIFREYDIRGVADRDLSSELATALARSYVCTLRDELPAGLPITVALARDGRLSSPRLHEAVTEGLLQAGANVFDVGIGPTPLLYFAAHHLSTHGAIMITASHNDAPDNGFKMMRGKGSFFGADIQALAARIESDKDNDVRFDDGNVTMRDLSSAYIAAVKTSARIERTDIKFVVDAGNGSAGPLGIATLRALGFSPDPLFCDIDGTFPNHHPDPTVPKNLTALIARMKETGAELGIAWDGDGDRLGAVDKNGDIVWGDKLLILFARALLAERPGSKVLGEVKCSATLYADIEKHGGKPIVWKTGHSLIKTKMKEEGALLAGEMSGHMFFADRWPGFDDATYATVRLLEILGRERKTMGELLSNVPATFATPEIRFTCPDAVKFEVVRQVTEHYKKSHSVLDIDGARIDFGDGAWGLCRASNTGPVLVLRFEAATEARRDAIKAEVESVVAGAVKGLTAS